MCTKIPPPHPFYLASSPLSITYVQVRCGGMVINRKGKGIAWFFFFILALFINSVSDSWNMVQFSVEFFLLHR